MRSLIIPAESLPAGTCVVAYCRVSEATQVSNGGLRAQERSALSQVRALGLRLKGFVSGAEYGKLSADRQHLLRAIGLARRHGAGIVAADLSRLLRAESFDKATNRLAVPTPGEVAALRALAEGVPFLATIAPPGMSPSELHSRAVKRGMRATGNPGGRPSSIDFRLAGLIWNDHHGGDSLRRIADRYGLTKSAVQRAVRKMEQALMPARGVGECGGGAVSEGFVNGPGGGRGPYRKGTTAH
jgi:hypothetical protein